MDEKQIQQFSFWLKFVAIITIIYGGMYSLSVIGAIIGVPLILAGLALLKSSKDILNYQNYKAPETAETTFLNIFKFFKILGIIGVVGIALTLLSAILGFTTYQRFSPLLNGSNSENTIVNTSLTSSSGFANSSAFNYFSTSSNYSESSNFSTNFSQNSYLNDEEEEDLNNSSNTSFSNSSVNTRDFVNGSGASSSRILSPNQGNDSNQNNSRSTSLRNSVSSDSTIYEYRIN